MQFNIQLSFSKIMAFLMLVLSFAFAFYTKDATLPTIAIPTVAATLSFKQYNDKKQNGQEKTK